MKFSQATSRIAAQFLLACLCGSLIAAETNPPAGKKEIFQLKNGDRITGVVLSEDSTLIKVDTAWQKGLLLPVGEIEKRQPAVTETAGAGSGVSGSSAASKLPASATKPVTAAATATAEKPKDKGVLKGNIQVGADLRDSSVQSYLYSLVAKLNYSQGNWHNLADYRYSYGKTDKLLSTDRMDGSFKTDLDIGTDKKWFFYGLAGAGYDTIRKIDIQYEVGPGVGRHLLTRTNMTLSAETGFTYQQQDFSNAAAREEMRVRFAGDFFWRINSKFSLENKAEIQPAFDDLGDYRARLEATISYVLWNNITWNVALIDLFDSRPTAGVTQNDLQIRSGVGIKF